MPARTPAMTAMTAMSLDQLSGGRFILGIGPSGPQVVEGWHGVAYGKPLTRTREYITIVRKILSRESPVEFKGEHYQIPYAGGDATGLGKPLKSILHGNPAIPIYTASISPAGLRLAGEIADGVFPIMMDPEKFETTYLSHLQEGFARAGGGKSLSNFAVVPSVNVLLSDDLDAARTPIKTMLSLYIGGMGARGKNFYNDLAGRLGYPEAAGRIQDLFLEGRKAEAAAAVPDALVDAIHLVGPKERIRERLQAWKEAGRRGYVETLQIGTAQPEALDLIAAEIL
jgi:F420-dependent oxidoreductase-like protein